MKKLIVVIACLVSSTLCFGQTVTYRDLISKFTSVMRQVAPEYDATWAKCSSLMDRYDDIRLAEYLSQVGVGIESYSILDSLDTELKSGNISCKDSLRRSAVNVSEYVNRIIISMVPSFQGIDIDGTVEELAKQYEKKGWEDYWMSSITKKDMKEEGYSLQQLHQKSGGTVVMDGIFRRKPAELILWPVSEEDNNVSYIALSMQYQETNLQSFKKYDLMPLIEEYSRKYGEYTITEESGRYHDADSYASSYSFSPQDILVYVHFEVPSVSLRVQVTDDYKFQIIVYYVNGYNFLRTENLNNDEI